MLNFISHNYYYNCRFIIVYLFIYLCDSKFTWCFHKIILEDVWDILGFLSVWIVRVNTLDIIDK